MPRKIGGRTGSGFWSEIHVIGFLTALAALPVLWVSKTYFSFGQKGFEFAGAMLGYFAMVHCLLRAAPVIDRLFGTLVQKIRSLYPK